MNNFVISLTSATDRREHITHAFQQQVIDFLFFDAVTTDQIDSISEELQVQVSRQYLSPIEIACLLSHLKLWQLMITQSIPYIAIFEDDIHLSKNASSFLNDFLWIPNGTEIIKLEMFHDKIARQYFHKKIVKDLSLEILLEPHVGTAGYIISIGLAEKLLQQLRKKHITLAIDHILFTQLLKSNTNIWQMNPPLCIQDNRLNKNNGSLPSQLESQRKKHLHPAPFQAKSQFTLAFKIKRELIRPVKQCYLWIHRQPLTFK